MIFDQSTNRGEREPFLAHDFDIWAGNCKRCDMRIDEIKTHDPCDEQSCEGVPPGVRKAADRWAKPEPGQRRTRIYLSGPITKGDQAANVHRAIVMFNRLLDHGYAVLCPHLTHFSQAVQPREYESWMQLDFAFIPVTDCVYRLEGESEGSDRETAFAHSRGIPVYYSVDTLLSGMNIFREDRDPTLSEAVAHG